MRANPYQIIKGRYITEKATVLENLKKADSNPSLKRCESPKYVFLVDPAANKHEIKTALEEIYAKQNITVTAVNTILVKPKRYNRRGNLRPGRDILVKKAYITLQKDDEIKD